VGFGKGIISGVKWNDLFFFWGYLVEEKSRESENKRRKRRDAAWGKKRKRE
jgi:hypothetical protein